MKVKKLVLTVLVTIAAAFPPALLAQENYTLAIVPQGPAVQIAQNWMPFAQLLSRESGVNIQIKTYYSSIPQFESDLMNGVPDFAYMNPYHVIMVHKAQGYVPFMRDADPLVGILVAHKGGSVHSVQDLNGKTIAFPSPNSFAASLYMRALLSKKENVHFTPRYVQTHGNVYRHVALDMVAAGGGVKDTLMNEASDIKNQLQIIYMTPPSVSHPLAVHPRVPEEVRQKVMNAILKLASNPANNAVFEHIQIDKPVAADYQKDYAPLTKLGLEKFVVKGSE